MDTNLQEEKYQPFLEELIKCGFCTIKIFDNEKISALQNLYENYFDNQKIEGLYASHNSNPVEKSLKISSDIREIVFPDLEKIFPAYDYFIGHFMVKGPHVQKEMALHQDWNIVDESKYKSYQIWIPLQFTDLNNGGIFLVPGSHKFFNNWRSGSYGIPIIPFDEKLAQIVTDIVIPAGAVLVYQNALFHGSYPNNTGNIRIAVMLNIIEKSAPVYYYHKNDKASTTELFHLGANELISCLPLLEKGEIPPALVRYGTLEISPINNGSITSVDIVNAYNAGNADKAINQ